MVIQFHHIWSSWCNTNSWIRSWTRKNVSIAFLYMKSCSLSGWNIARYPKQYRGPWVYLRYIKGSQSKIFIWKDNFYFSLKNHNKMECTRRQLEILIHSTPIHCVQSKDQIIIYLFLGTVQSLHFCPVAVVYKACTFILFSIGMLGGKGWFSQGSISLSIPCLYNVGA